MADEIQLVVFTLQQGDTVCEYGVTITQVQEIIPMAKTTKLLRLLILSKELLTCAVELSPLLTLKSDFRWELLNLPAIHAA